MITLTKKELATAAGYTYRRLYDIDKSLPDNEKLFVTREDGKCDLAEFVQRWVKYNVERDSGEEKSLEEVKAIHERVKTVKTELEVQRMKNQLIDVNDVRKLWGEIANTVMQRLIRLPASIAPQILMMDNVERVAGILSKEIRDALTEIAETPLPEYAAAYEPEEDEEQEE